MPWGSKVRFPCFCWGWNSCTWRVDQHSWPSNDYGKRFPLSGKTSSFWRISLMDIPCKGPLAQAQHRGLHHHAEYERAPPLMCVLLIFTLWRPISYSYTRQPKPKGNRNQTRSNFSRDPYNTIETPEHCLVNGGFPLFWSMFQLVATGIFLRSPACLSITEGS